MADVKQTSKSYISDRTNTVLGVMAPGSESGGYADRNITAVDFVKPENDKITALQLRAAILEGQMESLVLSSLNFIDLDKTTSYNFPMPADSLLEGFAVKCSEDTTFKIGLTAGGDELVEETTILLVNKGSYFTLNYPFYAITNVYVTILSGKITITRFIKVDLYT
jgi:hypothetical protein